MDTNYNSDDVHGHPLIDMIGAVARLNIFLEEDASKIEDPTTKASLESCVDEINMMFSVLREYILNLIVEGSAFKPPSVN